MTFKDPRIVFGFSLLLILAFLAIRIALGHVEQQTSFGLEILLNSLAFMGGAFVNWCFGKKD